MITLSVLQLLLVIALGSAFMLFFCLNRVKPRYRKSALYIGLFIVGYLIRIVNLVVTPVIQPSLTFIIPTLPVLFFLPVLFLFFVRSIFDPEFTSAGPTKYLWVPGLVDVGYQLFAWLYVQQIQTGNVYDFITGRTGFFTYEGLAIGYSVFCLSLMLKTFLRANGTRRAAFHFLKYIVVGVLLILLNWVVNFSFDLIAPGSYPPLVPYVVWITTSTFLLYMGYRILTAPKRLSTVRTVIPDQEALRAYASKLEALLTDRRLFTRPDLTRKDIAEELEVSEGFVSAILKEGLKTSFYELVNRFRIGEAIGLIEQGSLESITVDALSKEVGFNSRATFNKAFKSTTGLTPTRYWKEKVYG